jgi:hypothetical protein
MHTLGVSLRPYFTLKRYSAELKLELTQLRWPEGPISAARSQMLNFEQNRKNELLDQIRQ